MKKIAAALLLAAVHLACAASEDIDSILNKAGADMVAPLEKGAILCILAFSAPTQDMSEYIQTQLTAKATEAGAVKVVTRAHMDKVDEAELPAVRACQRRDGAFHLPAARRDSNRVRTDEGA